MDRPMKPNTLRQGKRIYGFTGTQSPNYKGATAVRPDEALNGTKVKKAAILRRLTK